MNELKDETHIRRIILGGVRCQERPVAKGWPNGLLFAVRRSATGVVSHAKRCMLDTLGYRSECYPPLDTAGVPSTSAPWGGRGRARQQSLITGDRLIAPYAPMSTLHLATAVNFSIMALWSAHTGSSSFRTIQALGEKLGCRGRNHQPRKCQLPGHDVRSPNSGLPGALPNPYLSSAGLSSAAGCFAV